MIILNLFSSHASISTQCYWHWRVMDDIFTDTPKKSSSDSSQTTWSDHNQACVYFPSFWYDGHSWDTLQSDAFTFHLTQKYTSQFRQSKSCRTFGKFLTAIVSVGGQPESRKRPILFTKARALDDRVTVRSQYSLLVALGDEIEVVLRIRPAKRRPHVTAGMAR